MACLTGVTGSSVLADVFSVGTGPLEELPPACVLVGPESSEERCSDIIPLGTGPPWATAHTFPPPATVGATSDPVLRDQVAGLPLLPAVEGGAKGSAAAASEAAIVTLT